MHVYTWLAHLDIRIEQNTPFWIKDWKNGPHPQWGGGHPLPTPHPSASLAPRSSRLRRLTSAPRAPSQTKCLDPPLLSPQTPTGAPPLDPAGWLSSPDPLICPPLEKNPAGANGWQTAFGDSAVTHGINSDMSIRSSNAVVCIHKQIINLGKLL